MSTSVDYPICLRLQGRPVLLVGGGLIAEGRALQLLEAGALPRMVAPGVTPALRRLAEEGRLEWVEREYASGDVRGHHVVFVATDDEQVSQRVAEEARALGIWVNAADLPDLCDFTLPSVGRRGPIVVAVSTSGQAPALARHLRRQFLEQVGLEHVQLARLSGWIRKRLPRGAERMRLLKQLVEDEASALRAGNQRREFWARLRTALQTLGEKS
ncbi:MAG TPA: bifunctional precorrin-2 dehydrogenase/sirohydrochlorin ferrochelatase [Longimicrobiales bacterium]|nr:bifunctional precorrin-2 dehydrogenase/sirohydrochlorin ferrochelatase [Longimicrobiales bacterium]